MSNVVLRNIIRFVFLFLLQVAIFKRLNLEMGDFTYISILVYPLFIYLLPIKTPKALSLTLAFVMGLCIDGFYDSPGVHAAALVFTAYIRGLILRLLEPFEGYSIDQSPTMESLGFSWFISYVSILTLTHCFVYFSIESFSFVYIFEIVMNTIFSFIPSVFIMVLLQIIFRSKH